MSFDKIALQNGTSENFQLYFQILGAGSSKLPKIWKLVEALKFFFFFFFLWCFLLGCWYLLYKAILVLLNSFSDKKVEVRNPYLPSVKLFLPMSSVWDWHLLPTWTSLNLLAPPPRISQPIVIQHHLQLPTWILQILLHMVVPRGTEVNRFNLNIDRTSVKLMSQLRKMTKLTKRKTDKN